MTAFVYLLPHASAPRFKIGKAVDLAARIRQLGASRFNVGQSLALRVASEPQALNLERLLHRAFSAARIAPSEIEATGENTDGDTEWFRDSCRPRLMRFLDDNRDILDMTLVGAPEIEQLLAKSVKPRSDKTKVKEQKREQRSQLCLSTLVEAEMAQVETCVSRVHERIQELIRLAPDAHLEADGTGYGTLRGTYSPEKEQEVSACLHTLFDEGLIRTHSGGFSMITGIGGIRDKVKPSFKLSLIWPEATPKPRQSFQYAADLLAALPIPVPGWAPLSLTA